MVVNYTVSFVGVQNSKTGEIFDPKGLYNILYQNLMISVNSNAQTGQVCDYSAVLQKYFKDNGIGPISPILLVKSATIGRPLLSSSPTTQPTLFFGRFNSTSIKSVTGSRDFNELPWSVCVALTPVKKKTSLLTTKEINNCYSRKIIFYFLDYLYLFLSITAILLVLRYFYLRHVKGRVITLAKSAAKGTVYLATNAPKPPETKSKSTFIKKIDGKHKKRVKEYEKALEKRKKDGFVLADTDPDILPEEFYFYLLKHFTVLGCEPIVYPDGLRICGYQFAKGMVEDLLLYISIKHRLIRCIFVPKGSMQGGIESTQIYIVKSALIFALIAICDSIIRENLVARGIDPDSPSSYAGLRAFNFLVLQPIGQQASFLCSYLLTWSYKAKKESEERMAVHTRQSLHEQSGTAYYFFQSFATYYASLIIISIVFVLLIIASLFTVRPKTTDLIVGFLTVNMLPSAALKIADILSSFNSKCHIHISLLFGYYEHNSGIRYCELLRQYGKVEGVDYKVRSIGLWKFFRFQLVTNMGSSTVLPLPRMVKKTSRCTTYMRGLRLDRRLVASPPWLVVRLLISSREPHCKRQALCRHHKSTPLA